MTCNYWLDAEGEVDTACLEGAGALFKSIRHDVLSGCKPALDALAVGRLRQLTQEAGVRGIGKETRLTEVSSLSDLFDSTGRVQWVLFIHTCRSMMRLCTD